MTFFAHGGISIKLFVVYLRIINECLSYKFHPYWILTGHTKVESVVAYYVLKTLYGNVILWFDHFLESGAEICQSFRWNFGKFKNIEKTFWNYLTFTFCNSRWNMFPHHAWHCDIQVFPGSQVNNFFYLFLHLCFELKWRVSQNQVDWFF